MVIKATQKPEYLALERSRLDARKQVGSRRIEMPDGWIRAVRTAIGMSAAQLAKRLGVTQQAVANTERNERNRTVSLVTLAKVAEALECELVVEFRPKTSLEDTVWRQAANKATAERNRVVHTMRLEAKHDGVEHVLNTDSAIREWMTTRISKLWD